MKRIVITGPGPASTLCLEEVSSPVLGPGKLLVRLEWAGLNFIDINHRSGAYPLPSYPSPIGYEGAGRVTAVGPGVEESLIGRKVAICPLLGCYAEEVVLDQSHLFFLPDAISTKLAATAILQGLTALMLTEFVHMVNPGERCLIHSGAGGLGQILIQLVQKKGATVITTVSSQEKKEIVEKLGAEQVIVCKEFTQPLPVKVDLIYDGVGKSALEANLRSLREFGHWISYGQASGPIEELTPSKLKARSLTLSAPVLFHYLKDDKRRKEAGERLFALLAEGEIATPIGGEFPLALADEAHRFLEERRSVGKVLLKV